MKRIISVIAALAVMTALFCACGKTDTKKVDAKPLSDIFSEMKEKYQVTDLMEYTDKAALNHFYGIAEDDVEEFAGGMNNSGVDQEEIVLIKATDADAAGRVADALNKRRDAKLSQNKNYNAEQYAIIEKSSVDVDDTYVSMIISEDSEDMKADYKAALGVK